MQTFTEKEQMFVQLKLLVGYYNEPKEHKLVFVETFCIFVVKNDYLFVFCLFFTVKFR